MIIVVLRLGGFFSFFFLTRRQLTILFQQCTLLLFIPGPYHPTRIFSPVRVREGYSVFYHSAQRLFVVLSLVFSIRLAMLFMVVKDVQIENVPMISFNSLVDRINPYFSFDGRFSNAVDHNLNQ